MSSNNSVSKISTLVYRIDVQDQINVQVEKFLKNIKRAGQNRRAEGKIFSKSINVQTKIRSCSGDFILKINKFNTNHGWKGYLNLTKVFQIIPKVSQSIPKQSHGNPKAIPKQYQSILINFEKISPARSFFGLYIYWFWEKVPPCTSIPSCTFIGIGMFKISLYSWSRTKYSKALPKQSQSILKYPKVSIRQFQ